MIKFLEKRKYLVDHLQALSDYSYQKENWKLLQSKGISDFDEAIHFIFDDSALADDTYGEIGFLLKSNEEADAIAKLVKSLKIIFDKYGIDLTDNEYIQKAEWVDVVKSAKNALNVLFES